jgi:hypothetical protein
MSLITSGVSQAMRYCMAIRCGCYLLLTQLKGAGVEVVLLIHATFEIAVVVGCDRRDKKIADRPRSEIRANYPTFPT